MITWGVDDGDKCRGNDSLIKIFLVLKTFLVFGEPPVREAGCAPLGVRPGLSEVRTRLSLKRSQRCVKSTIMRAVLDNSTRRV